MAFLANHRQLVEDAERRANEYRARQKEQERTDDGFTFAAIGTYASSEAEKEQLRRLAAIQQEANETVFDSRIRF